MMFRACCIAGAIALLLATGAAHAQYPAKAIRVIVPFAPGGPSDFLMRTVGQKLTEAWGQQLLVDNRGGANGIVGSDLVAKSAPDGYTWGIATNGTHGINASLFSKMPFDTVKDFAPVTRLGNAAYLLVAHPSLPVRSVKELIALAKARPGEINWSAGGSPSQLSAELFKKTAGINLAVIPYKGNALAVTAALSGEVSLTFGSIMQSMPQVKAGRLRALGVGSLKRSPVIPEVPAIAESGYPGFEAGAWYGVLVQGATPRAIVDRINGEIVRVLNLPDVQQRLRGEAFDIPADTPDQFSAVIRAELAKWAPIVKAAGLRGE
jgi:tripartite-type tricarboxylate transporter receptor subunit TctC